MIITYRSVNSISESVIGIVFDKVLLIQAIFTHYRNSTL